MSFILPAVGDPATAAWADSIGLQGSIGHSVVGSNITGITNVSSTYLTVTASLIAGRKYLGIANFSGVQNTAAAIVTVSIGPPVGPGTFLWFQSATAGETVYGTASTFYAPGSSGSASFVCVAATAAGTLTVLAGASLAVIDLGTI